MKLLIEIRPGEGGEDAKLLVADQASIYARFAEHHGAKVEIEDRGHL
jgi:protein subunit release factor A